MLPRCVDSASTLFEYALYASMEILIIVRQMLLVNFVHKILKLTD